jgi:outer membrane protein assembly factor BamE (lipoprotein component of BamABCDE complex)
MRRVGWVVLALVLAVFAVSAQAGDDKAKSEPPKKEAAHPKGVAAPAGSKLAKVEKKMTQEQVRKIMGEPSNEKSYITGQAFNPWNYGGNSGQNVEWDYKGVGRVIFTVHRWTHQLVVIRIDYDPTEQGD